MLIYIHEVLGHFEFYALSTSICLLNMTIKPRLPCQITGVWHDFVLLTLCKISMRGIFMKCFNWKMTQVLIKTEESKLITTLYWNKIILREFIRLKKKNYEYKDNLMPFFKFDIKYISDIVCLFIKRNPIPFYRLYILNRKLMLTLLH